MMRALIERFGADYEQWRALTRAALKVDMRRARVATMSSRRAKSNPFTGQIIFYGAVGLVFAGVTVLIVDTFLAATLITTYAMFMVGVLVLLDYYTVVTSPDDYTVLGFQPISSQTFFLARLTNLLIYAMAVSSLIAGPSALALLFREHMQGAVAAAVMLSAWLGCAATALAMVLLYGSLVRRVPARRMTRALSYLQLSVSFLLYGGYMILPQYLQRMGIAHLKLARTWTLLLFPPAWYASLVDVARAQFSASALLFVMTGFAALVLLARTASGKISLDFAEKLAQMATTGTTVRTTANSAARLRWFRDREPRAIWILIRGQFRSDQKFRMGVLSILPMTVLYLFMSVSQAGAIRDPFTVHGLHAGNAAMLYMAVILFPIMLNSTMTRSENYKAAWVFYGTATDREAIIIAMKNAVFVSFVLPYLAVMGAIFLFWFHNVLHVLVHLAYLALVSHFGLLILMLADPQLPFARPSTKGERSSQLFMVTLLSGILAAVAIPLTVRFVYISAMRTVIMFALLGLATFGMERLGRVRVRRLISTAEFAG